MSDKYFTQINTVMTDEQKAEILAIQTDLSYLDEVQTGDQETDGNFYSKLVDTAILPEWFHTMYADLIGPARRVVFLKNRGSVARHTDLTPEGNRDVALTIPLNTTATATRFWATDGSTRTACNLLHDGKPYLINVSKWHSVGDSDETRYFIQFSYDGTYDERRTEFTPHWA